MTYPTERLLKKGNRESLQNPKLMKRIDCIKNNSQRNARLEILTLCWNMEDKSRNKKQLRRLLIIHHKNKLWQLLKSLQLLRQQAQNMSTRYHLESPQKIEIKELLQILPLLKLRRRLKLLLKKLLNRQKQLLKNLLDNQKKPQVKHARSMAKP
jgi:hypothetical protein